MEKEHMAKEDESELNVLRTKDETLVPHGSLREHNLPLVGVNSDSVQVTRSSAAHGVISKWVNWREVLVIGEEWLASSHIEAHRLPRQFPCFVWTPSDGKNTYESGWVSVFLTRSELCLSRGRNFPFLVRCRVAEWFVNKSGSWVEKCDGGFEHFLGLRYSTGHPIGSLLKRICGHGIR